MLLVTSLFWFGRLGNPGRNGAEESVVANRVVEDLWRYRVVNPRYTTLLPDGTELFTSADWAEPEPHDRSQIRLSNVIASGGDESELIASAVAGLLRSREGVIVLTESARILGAPGESLESEELVIDAGNKVIRSAEPVELNLNSLRIEANSIRIEEAADGGLEIAFAGGVRARYHGVPEETAE